MPFAQITMIEGRTDEQKRAVVKNVTEALHQAVGAPLDTIRVMIQEVPSLHWGIAGETVLDIKNKKAD